MSKILIIDPDPSIQSVFEYVFGQASHSLEGSQTLSEALLKHHSFKPDIVFLSLESDKEIIGIQKLIKLDDQLLIFALIDHSNASLIPKIYEQGCYGIIFKPFDVEEILSMIEHIRLKVLKDV